LRELNISLNRIVDMTVFDSIVSALGFKKTKLESLDLSSTNIKDPVVIKLLDQIRLNPYSVVRSLNFTNNYLSDNISGDIVNFCQPFQDHKVFEIGMTKNMIKEQTH
jgi:hypothetical protein